MLEGVAADGAVVGHPELLLPQERVPEVAPVLRDRVDHPFEVAPEAAEDSNFIETKREDLFWRQVGPEPDVENFVGVT